MESLNISQLNLYSGRRTESQDNGIKFERTREKFETNLLTDQDEEYHCEYKEEIWKNLLEQESEKPTIHLQSPQLEFRGSLVQQLRNVTKKLGLSIATLHSAVAQLDLFMDAHRLRADRLTHVALACLSLAAKSEEKFSRAPTLKTLSKISGVQLCGKTFRQLEWMVGQHVRWRLLSPTPVTYAALLAQYVVTDSDLTTRHPKFVRRFKRDGAKLLEAYLDLTLSDVRLKVVECVDVGCACVACARADLGLVAWPAWLATRASRQAAAVAPIARLLQRMMQIMKSREASLESEVDQGYGMQRNPGVRTIEEDLLKALYDAKYITKDDFENQQNAQFQRSSRTDKGVSAARQVVSLKLPLDADVDEINKNLPKSIKVFGIKRVTNRFNSKSKCNARTYSYTLPTYVFEPSLLTFEERKQYRITEDKLEQVKKVLEVYKGTKNYHNFTEKKHSFDPSALRYMMSFAVDRVFVESDMEFAVLLVKGQSFMLHQIRKMVGLAIAVLRGHADSSVLEKSFGKEKVMIPTAPGLGLVLDMVHYDRYDNKFKKTHDSLSWDDQEINVRSFKHEQIYPIIVKGEVEDNSMGLWLEKLSLHSYEPSDDTNEKDGNELPDGDDDDIDDGDDKHDDCDHENDGERAKSDEGVKYKDATSNGSKNNKDS